MTTIRNGVVISAFLHFIANLLTGHSIAYINRHSDEIVNGLFLIDIHQVHTCWRRNCDFRYNKLIIVSNLDGNGKKRMVVFTAESLESELVELDCSGMRENEIIDMNEEGRRWEGGELNGKPFGFGCEYSENGNLVYEGFVFEGMKVCYGKEWNDDGNNNCLVYEGVWMNNHTMTENEKNELIVPMSIEEFVVGNEMLESTDAFIQQVKN